MKIGDHRGSPSSGQRRRYLVPTSPGLSVTRERSAPRIVAIEHAEQNRQTRAPTDGGATDWRGRAMERQLERCGGLDVHKETVAACVRVGGRTGQAEQHVQTFGTTVGELLVLRDWLAAHGVTHVAMESTGVYWKPVFYALESDFTCLLVNAAHIKQVPGRKTDVKDCVWIAQLLEHGLLKASLVPPRPQQELRELTRQRAQLVGEQGRATQRIQKVLEDANIKLASVASDVLGYRVG